MKIEVTAKEITKLYDEFNGLEWILNRQADPYQVGNDLSSFGIKVGGLDSGGAHGISHATKNQLVEELAEVTKKFLERRKLEIANRFEQLKLPIE